MHERHFIDCRKSWCVTTVKFWLAIMLRNKNWHTPCNPVWKGFPLEHRPGTNPMHPPSPHEPPGSRLPWGKWDPGDPPAGPQSAPSLSSSSQDHLNAAAFRPTVRGGPADPPATGPTEPAANKSCSEVAQRRSCPHEGRHWQALTTRGSAPLVWWNLNINTKLPS